MCQNGLIRHFNSVHREIRKNVLNDASMHDTKRWIDMDMANEK